MNRGFGPHSDQRSRGRTPNRNRRGSETGTVPRPCDNCSTQFTPSEDSDKIERSFCEGCRDEFRQYEDLQRVGGSWRIRDDDERETIINELSDKYIISVKDRLNEVQLYKQPEE